MSALGHPVAARAVERCERLAELGPPPSVWRPWKLRRWLRAHHAIMALDISQSAEMLRDLYPVSALEELAARPMPWLYDLDRRGPT